MTTAARAPLDTRPMALREDELGLVQGAFAENGRTKPIDALAWQYFATPGGEPIVDFAVDRSGSGERIAGMYAVVQVPAGIEGRRVRAAQSLDTLTAAAYRGRGVFTTLAASVYAQARDAGIEFVYGFPNGNSVHGLFAKLAWDSLDPLPFLIRPLRTRYALARVPRVGGLLRALPDLRLPQPRAPRLRAGETLAEVERFGPEFDDLWARAQPELPVAVCRDGAYLGWRFAKPGEAYRTAAIRSGGRLLGFVTWCVQEKHGGRIGYLMEMLRDPAHPRVGDELMRHAVREMSASGAEVALAWCFDHSPTRSAHRAAGFVAFPPRLRPIELHMGVLVLDPAVAAPLRRRENWYISYCDSDTV
jgi:GNAT superfamily N-acetyltransferase